MLSLTVKSAVFVLLKFVFINIIRQKSYVEFEDKFLKL